MSEEEPNIQSQINHKKTEQVEQRVQNINHRQKDAENQNREPYIYTDYGISDDELELKVDNKEERLALQNKRYIEVLKKGSALFHENQSKQYLIKKKQAELNQERSRLEHLRNERLRESIKKKQALAVKKQQLQKTIDYQTMRLSDLTYTLELLKQLNSMPITQVPSEIYTFQQFITQYYSKMAQTNTPQKVHCILAQQSILLDNLLSIRDELIKE